MTCAALTESSRSAWPSRRCLRGCGSVSRRSHFKRTRRIHCIGTPACSRRCLRCAHVWAGSWSLCSRRGAMVKRAAASAGTFFAGCRSRCARSVDRRFKGRCLGRTTRGIAAAHFRDRRGGETLCLLRVRLARIGRSALPGMRRGIQSRVGAEIPCCSVIRSCVPAKVDAPGNTVLRGGRCTRVLYRANESPQFCVLSEAQRKSGREMMKHRAG